MNLSFSKINEINIFEETSEHHQTSIDPGLI